MVDYGKLADRAKALQQARRRGGESPQTPPDDPGQLYEKVKICVLQEADKANKELSKRGMVLIQRVLSPSYSGRLCLSLGISLLCNVEYTPHPDGGCRIKAILSGPPNGAEISRKEFLAVNESPEREKLERLGNIPWAIGLAPQNIAVEIVSGMLAGEFA
jgi:hypothetical protein